MPWFDTPRSGGPRVHEPGVIHPDIIEHGFDSRKVGGGVVSREVIYRCTGPDCDISVHSAAPPPSRGWIVVHEREGESVTVLDFCGWQCLLRFAGRIDPEEVVEVEGLR